MPKILSLNFILLLSVLANAVFLQNYKQLEEDKKVIIQQNQRLQDQIIDLNHQNEALKEKFMEQQNTYQKNNDEFENQIIKLRNESGNLNYQIKKLKNENDSLNYQIKKLINENGSLKKQLTSRNSIKNSIAQKSIKPKNGSDVKSGRKLIVSTSAYTAHDAGMNGKGITAMGTKVTDGRTIAVDPNVIKLGSKVYIEGLGHRIAEDTGKSIKGNKIDIYFNSKSKALKWGRRKVEITVIN